MSDSTQRVYCQTQWDSLEDCKQFAGQVASRIEEPLCIGLVGTLGAGKTQFVRYFVTAMAGDADQVSSPTFVLVNQYHARLPIAHLDLYRLERPLELESFGFDDIVYGESVCLIEWADKFTAQMPPETLWLDIRPRGETREVNVSAAIDSPHVAIVHALRSEAGNAS